jgi:3-oxoacyl-[acyl-carrier protein] reductase
MDLQLGGKSAIVTGSTRGIGRAIAEALAGEGASVMVHGRRQRDAAGVAAGLRKRSGVPVEPCAADLSTDSGAELLVDAAVEGLGSIDVLVNNAGTYSFDSTWSNRDAAAWLEQFNVNVASAVRLIRLVVPRLKEQGWGRVVNVSSTDAVAPSANLPEYAASKAALANITLSLADECRGTGVTANTVTPGVIATETVLQYVRVEARRRGWTGNDRELMALALPALFGDPRGAWGKPADVAYITAVLCSPLADWVNGVDYRVDGAGVQGGST